MPSVSIDLSLPFLKTEDSSSFQNLNNSYAVKKDENESAENDILNIEYVIEKSDAESDGITVRVEMFDCGSGIKTEDDPAATAADDDPELDPLAFKHEHPKQILDIKQLQK